MPDAMQRCFRPEPQSVGPARDFATAVLTAWGLAALVEDIRLCVSELAANAVLHGASDGREPFAVTLSADDQQVHLEVRDSRRPEAGAWPEVRRARQTETSGRGLLIVEMLATSWGVEDRPPWGKAVWARFRVGESPPGGQSEAGRS